MSDFSDRADAEYRAGLARLHDGDEDKYASILLKIEDFLVRYPDAEFGPAHIVLSDYNLEDEHIHYCIKRLNVMWMAAHREEHKATMDFLKELLTIPEEERVTRAIK